VIPETFRMDSTRLTTFHNDYQDISIMCSLLLLFRQSSGPKATPDHIIQLKKQLWILLNDSETTMENVVLAITQKAGEIRAKPFGAAETKMVGNLVDKTLSFDSPLFEVIMKRVGEVLKLYLADGTKLSAEILRKYGLSELEEEILDLAERVKVLAEHNRRTYSSVYDIIVKEWKEKKGK
ncbi:T-complex 11, partial [Paraphysoderma sedebokerense]